MAAILAISPDERPATEPRSWAPEVKIDGTWSRNALRFRTEAEAKRSATALFMRWTVPTDARAAGDDEEPNYTLDLDTGDLTRIEGA